MKSKRLRERHLAVDTGCGLLAGPEPTASVVPSCPGDPPSNRDGAKNLAAAQLSNLPQFRVYYHKTQSMSGVLNWWPRPDNPHLKGGHSIVLCGI